MNFTPIAIVGRACLLPGAHNPQQLWDAVLSGKDLLSQVPPGRWRLSAEQALCDPDAPQAERSWSDRGGYVDGFEAIWNPHGFALSAEQLAGLDPLVHWLLHCSRQALSEVRSEHGRVGAVIGNLGFPSGSMAAFADQVWRGGAGPGEAAVDPRNRFMSGGSAQIIEQALVLQAGSYCLDAACASSLYAIKLGCDQLAEGSADLILAGAVQRADDLFLHIGFSALNALSRSGQSRPFHRDADGLVPAEGCALLALKRLTDARRDGDTIHAVIRGIGLSNDGRGKGLLVPDPAGQQRAMAAAYASAGIDPCEVGLLECHATGTSVGDAAELQSSAEIFANAKGLPIGSLKSNLGHLITSAGAAGVIKLCEALRNDTLPPNRGVDAPIASLDQGPFRLLQQAEAWPARSPRIAAVSAFGFGGNNAHLILSDDDPQIPLPVANRASPIAIVGLGCLVGDTADRQRFAQALFEETPEKTPFGRAAANLPDVPNSARGGRMQQIELELAGLRFPPSDLSQTLPQQLAMLEAARQALSEVQPLPRERTAVLIGMEPDPEVARYGSRWRAAAQDGEQWQDWRDALIAPLQSAGVIGCMPNIPANRIGSQFDLAGPGFTVQAGAASGLQALRIACHALQHRQIDAALVGAVDLGCEAVNQQARRQTSTEAESQATTDAAVALVLKRVDDATAAGDRIYALIDTLETGDSDPPTPIRAQLGDAGAADGLLHAAVGALCLHYRRRPDGAPWLAASARRWSLAAAEPSALQLTEASSAPPRFEAPGLRLWIYAAADRAGVIAALHADQQSDIGQARLVLVGREDEFPALRERALAHLSHGGPSGTQIHYRDKSIGGELAFVFAGAGASYAGMGRDLLLQLPQLQQRLAERSQQLACALDWAVAGRAVEADISQQLWGASALSQLHLELSEGLLGLRADAWLGYSSGETNALVGAGVWRDADALAEEMAASGLLTDRLGGTFSAVREQWGGEVDWRCWTVSAPIDEVRSALAEVDRVYLAIINSDIDCLIAGDASGCAAVVERIGINRCLPLTYRLAVHVPELRAVQEPWLQLHRRQTHLPRHGRIYSSAQGHSYSTDRESCAQAILQQANQTLDMRKVVLQAYADGVRVFVEHGPGGSFGRAIRQILGDREALVVSLDRRGAGFEASLSAIGALIAAGVPVQLQRLRTLLEVKVDAPKKRPMRLPAHWPEVPPAPSISEPSEAIAIDDDIQIMAPAPPLPPVWAALAGRFSVEPPAPGFAAAHREQARSYESEEQGAANGPAIAADAAAPVSLCPDLRRSELAREIGVHADAVALGGEPARPDSPAQFAQQTSKASARPVSLNPQPSALSPAFAGARADLLQLWRSQLSQLSAQQTTHTQNLADAHARFLAVQRQGQQLLMAAAAGTAHVPGTQATAAAAGSQAIAAVHSLPNAQSPSATTPTATSAPAPALRPSRPGPQWSAMSAASGSVSLDRPARTSLVPASATATLVAPQATQPKLANPTPIRNQDPDAPHGPGFDRADLECHADGLISSLFGPLFAAQDGYSHQVRMPKPPLLLADRVLGIDAVAGSMGRGRVWTETDVGSQDWYLHHGRMPAGVMIEAGQADLLLISWLGVDALNQGRRVYRLLGCELTYHGDLPSSGDRLRFDIHIDSHAAQGDVRLMFFHYDSVNYGADGTPARPQLSVREGQAGFFTAEELAASAGCLWSPQTQKIDSDARLDPPELECEAKSLTREQLQSFAAGDTYACFGAGFEFARTHSRSPGIHAGRMLLLDRVTELALRGGPWNRGYLRAELDIDPQQWFFDGHFKNDPCMPGTLMFEACLQAMAVYLSACGYSLRRDGWRFQPIPEQPYQLQCRGQVTPRSRRLVTEVFIEERGSGPQPYVYADLLCTVDGLKAFHARRVGLQLVPDWPMAASTDGVPDARPVAIVDGFRFNQQALLACALGRPSQAFGPMYSRFDGPQRVARLPSPPYHFISRIAEIDGAIGLLKAGARVVAEYDLPDQVWYLDQNGCRRMPFAVLLEAALQPCGWLSSYVGSALTVDEELGFRNLDGEGTVLAELEGGAGILRTEVKLLEVSASAGMIIESFAVACFIDQREIYRLRTVFGFFPPEALAAQVGLPVSAEQRGLLQRDANLDLDLDMELNAHGAAVDYFDPQRPRLAGPMLRMIDRIDGVWPQAGEAGLGQLRAVKDIDSSEWFFKAHFFQDPVQPGSLGLEAMLQTLQFYLLHQGKDRGIENPRFETIGLDLAHRWRYRGQVLPHHRQVHTTVEITAEGVDERGYFAIADASLWVDGQRIYEASGLAVRIVGGA